MLNAYIELCSGARLIRIKPPVAKHLSYVMIEYVLTAGRLDNRGERYNRDFLMPLAYWLTACPWRRFRFEGDDAVAASPLKTDGDSMQSKLGSNAAQFAAELADRFGPARSERLARDFHDRVVEILGFARPVDSLPCESDHDTRHRRIFEQYLCRLLAVVLVGCDERASAPPQAPAGRFTPLGEVSHARSARQVSGTGGSFSRPGHPLPLTIPEIQAVQLVARHKQLRDGSATAATGRRQVPLAGLLVLLHSSVAKLGT